MLFKKDVLRVTGTLVLMFLFTTTPDSQELSKPVPVNIMFYNTENMFDITDDPLTNDNEFLPDGSRRWNKTRYYKKINSVSKSIIAAGGWDPPAVVGLCEIENRKVLEDLIYSSPLSNYDYGIIHRDSPDARGIDVGMIFRKDIVRVIDYRSWIPPAMKKDDFQSRSVLYVKCAILGDTIHLMINHWPSRRGGALSGEPLRKEISQMLRNAVDSLCGNFSGLSKIIILGDFNCDPEDPVIQMLVNPDETGGPLLLNLAEMSGSDIPGTYRYLGTWEMLDQIIVSPGLINCLEGLYADTGDFRIFKPDFLLKTDSKYPGLTTFSTYRGYRYQGGFSDHLPVLLDLGFR